MENVSICKGFSQKNNKEYFYINIEISQDYSIKKYLTNEEVLIFKLKGIIK